MRTMNARRFAYACFALALLLTGYASGALRAPMRTSLSPAAARAALGAPRMQAFNPASATTTPGYYSVVRVIDGDTVVVWYRGEEVTVRLMGMDTPEVVDPRKPVECFGPEASAQGKTLLTGKDVRLVPDPTQDQFDKYGRMLAYLYLPDGILYNEWMIRHGYAHEYTYKKAYEFQKDFKAAQAAAKAEQIGFWSPDTCGGATGVHSTEFASSTLAH